MDLLQDSVQVRQMLAVVEAGRPGVSDNAIDLGLGFALDLWVVGEDDEERIQHRNCLISVKDVLDGNIRRILLYRHQLKRIE